MTIKPPGTQLLMTDINAEFGLGNDLGAYRGVPWWMDDGQSGNFPATNLGMYQFYSKRATPPISNGFVEARLVTGSGPGWIAAGMSLGTPNAKRVIVVATATGDTTGSPISGVLINGVAATLAARSSGSGSMRACAVYYQALPTGDTADVRVNNSNNATNCVIGVYAIYPSNPAPVSGDSGNGTTTGASATSLTPQAGGICIAATHHRNTNPTTFAGNLGGPWTTDWNATIGGGAQGALGMKLTDGTGTTAQATWTGSVNGSIAAATWGPM